MVWYSHLFQNFPQFFVVHTVKGFGIVSKAEVDVFLGLSCFFDDPADVGDLISGSSAFSFFLVFTHLLGPSGRGLLPVNRGVHRLFSHSRLGPWGSWGWLGTSGMFPSSRRGTG